MQAFQRVIMAFQRAILTIERAIFSSTNHDRYKSRKYMVTDLDFVFFLPKISENPCQQEIEFVADPIIRIVLNFACNLL